MTMTEDTKPPIPLAPAMTFHDFLENQSPTKRAVVTEPLRAVSGGGHNREVEFRVTAPSKIALFCGTKPECGGTRTFNLQSQESLEFRPAHTNVIRYTCSNCERSSKTYAIISLMRTKGD